MVDLLLRLVHKSLVIAGPEPDGAHLYRLLEMLRQYAREKLLVRDKDGVAGTRHAAFFLKQVERLDWFEQASPLAPVRLWLGREHDEN